MQARRYMWSFRCTFVHYKADFFSFAYFVLFALVVVLQHMMICIVAFGFDVTLPRGYSATITQS